MAPHGIADELELDAPADVAFNGFPGKYGLLKTNIVSSYAGIGLLLGGPTSADGSLFLSHAITIADAWIAWGKTDPQNMRIVRLLFGNPLMTLVIAHVPIVGGMMNNHGIKASRLLMPVNVSALRSRLATGSSPSTGPSPVVSSNGGQEPAAPSSPFMSYQPVGPHAPTEDMGPPPPVETEEAEMLRVWPDEEMPAEVQVAAREVAKRTNRPYNEVLNEVRQQYANVLQQERLKAAKPGGLGSPVTKE